MIHYIFKFLAVILVILPFYLLIRRPFQRDLAREAGLGIFLLFTLGLLALALEGDYQSPVLMIRAAGPLIWPLYQVGECFSPPFATGGMPLWLPISFCGPAHKNSVARQQRILLK